MFDRRCELCLLRHITHSLPIEAIHRLIALIDRLWDLRVIGFSIAHAPETDEHLTIT